MGIDEWRQKIDGLDTALLHLLNLRAELALELGRLKDDQGLALRVATRERAILERMARLNPGPLDRVAVENIYQAFLEESRRLQQQQRACSGRP